MTQSPATLPGETKRLKTAIGLSSAACAKDIMQKDMVWANPDESVQQVLKKMQKHETGYIMVGENEALEGIVSKSDITGATSIYLKPIFAKWHRPLDDATLQIRIKWIMSRPVRTVKPDTPLAKIMENMCRFGGRCLPVVDEQGKTTGLLTAFDIFQILLNTSEDVSTVGKTAETPVLTETTT
jgi:CBS-domain-containing membrane protein